MLVLQEPIVIRDDVTVKTDWGGGQPLQLMQDVTKAHSALCNE